MRRTFPPPARAQWGGLPSSPIARTGRSFLLFPEAVPSSGANCFHSLKAKCCFFPFFFPLASSIEDSPHPIFPSGRYSMVADSSFLLFGPQPGESCLSLFLRSTPSPMWEGSPFLPIRPLLRPGSRWAPFLPTMLVPREKHGRLLLHYIGNSQKCRFPSVVAWQETPPSFFRWSETAPFSSGSIPPFFRPLDGHSNLPPPPPTLQTML